MISRQVSLILYLAAAIIFGLGCSAGKLVLQNPTPTPTSFKTPRPTYTYTPYWTATFTPTPTFTSTPTPTNTPTATPTTTPTPEEEPTAEEVAAPPPPPPPPPPPAEPTATPTPEEPTPTSTPEFEFQVVYYTHETGSPGETRMTAWIRRDSGPGKFSTLSGFQMKVLAPDGNSYLSELSGSGTADSTVPGTGDNHWMNTKLEISPYTPGEYKVTLVEGGVQVAPEVTVNISAVPLLYVHFDFFKSEP